MSKMLEIRWHGRGGQGVKTAALLLAEAAFVADMHIQGFPEYGPERMGAPVTAYNRISDRGITIHSNIYEPDIVVIVDETLIGGSAGVTSGLADDKAVIVNTTQDPNVIKEKLNFKGRVYTVDANGISHDTLGQIFPNVPMMGAVMSVCDLIEFNTFYDVLKNEFQKKFKGKDNIIAGNLKSLERAYQEVKQSV